MSYDHGQACKAEGLSYETWICSECAERHHVDFRFGVSYMNSGFCHFGKHRCATNIEMRWLTVDPDLVTPWPRKEPDVADMLTLDEPTSVEADLIASMLDMSDAEIEDMLS